MPTVAVVVPSNTEVLDRLLRSAEEVCSRDGISSARIEDFTRSAGVAKGTFYLYFASKEAIVHAVVDESFRDLGERCRRAVSSTGRARNVRSRTLVETHFDFYREFPGRMRILHQARGILKFGRPEWRPISRSLERHIALVAELLALPAELPADDRHDAARLLFGAVSGAASTWASAHAGALTRLNRDVAAPLARLVGDFTQARLRFVRSAEFR